MKIGIKMFYTIMLLLLAALCVGVVLVATQVIPLQTVHELVQGMVDVAWANILWIVGAAIIAILSICAIILGFSKGSKPATKAVKVVTNAKGTTNVSINALVELSQRYLNDVYGIVTQDIKIFPERDAEGVDIKLILAMKPEIEMPVTSETLMKGLSEYIKKFGGITTGEIIVTIVPLKHAPKK